MADHKEEKPAIDDEVTHKAELHEDVVKVEAEADDEPKDESQKTEVATPVPAKKGFDIKAFLGTKKGKIIAAIVAAAVVVGAVFAVPVTRYGVLGLFVKKDVTLTLVDSSTKKPVTDANVELAGMTAKSDSDGKVKFQHVPVGPQATKITKKYYKDSNTTVNVWVFSAAQPSQLSLEATGRQVPIKVVNKINGHVISGATVTAGDATTITDDNGDATLVVGAGSATVDATVKADGYNDQKATIAVVETFEEDNSVQMTPVGKVYFLSKRTGKINVMKSDLDGSNQEVVLAGTGKEDDGSTVLLASRDWKYLTLLAQRDSNQAKIYLIDTSNNGKLTVIDEGDVTFHLLGWVDHQFVYWVARNNTVPGSTYAMKSFNPESGKTITLDSSRSYTDTLGKTYGEYFASGPYLLANEIIFSKAWTPTTTAHGTPATEPKMGVYSIKADGNGEKTIVDVLNAVSYYYVRPYGPNDAYILRDGDVSNAYEYENGKLAKTNLTNEQAYGYQRTYLQSPSGKATFWSESRDGKTVLLTGDANGENEDEIQAVDGYKQYGWFTDDYLLVSKNDSELYILGRAAGSQPIKITDYHKPAYDYSYYGGGYGGF